MELYDWHNCNCTSCVLTLLWRNLICCAKSTIYWLFSTHFIEQEYDFSVTLLYSPIGQTMQNELKFNFFIRPYLDEAVLTVSVNSRSLSFEHKIHVLFWQTQTIGPPFLSLKEFRSSSIVRINFGLLPRLFKEDDFLDRTIWKARSK